ncbi:MAG: hypothetical protein HRU36_03225 [Rickettsiales bacterium]|nr:hypothetical protein [Rickettsiales bacterium]
MLGLSGDAERIEAKANAEDLGSHLRQSVEDKKKITNLQKSIESVRQECISAPLDMCSKKTHIVDKTGEKTVSIDIDRDTVYTKVFESLYKEFHLIREKGVKPGSFDWNKPKESIPDAIKVLFLEWDI